MKYKKFKLWTNGLVKMMLTIPQVAFRSIIYKERVRKIGVSMTLRLETMLRQWQSGQSNIDYSDYILE